MATRPSFTRLTEGPLTFTLSDARRLDRPLPHLTAGILWAGQRVVADPELQRRLRRRTDNLAVELKVRPAVAALRPVTIGVARRRGAVEISVTVDVDSHDRPDDRFLDGVAIVMNAYAAGVEQRKIPTSPAVAALVARAQAEDAGADLPARREWVGRMVTFRYPAENPDLAWLRLFPGRIEQTADDVEIQFHYAGIDPTDSRTHRANVQLFTAGPADAVAELIARTAAATGAPSDVDIVENEPFPRIERAPATDDTDARTAHTRRSALLVEIHVPLDSGMAWFQDVEDFLVGAEGGNLVHDDGEEWHTRDGQPEYLFFLSGADESTLLGVAREVAQLPGVPSGVYAVLNTTDGDMGDGRRVNLDDGDRRR